MSMKLQSVVWRYSFKVVRDFFRCRTLSHVGKKKSQLSYAMETFYSSVKEAGLPKCQSEIQEGLKKLRDSLE